MGGAGGGGGGGGCGGGGCGDSTSKRKMTRKCFNGSWRQYQLYLTGVDDRFVRFVAHDQVMVGLIVRHCTCDYVGLVAFNISLCVLEKELSLLVIRRARWRGGWSQSSRRVQHQ